mgnify:CR=1 FL=1
MCRQSRRRFFRVSLLELRSWPRQESTTARLHLAKWVHRTRDGAHRRRADERDDAEERRRRTHTTKRREEVIENHIVLPGEARRGQRSGAPSPRCQVRPDVRIDVVPPLQLDGTFRPIGQFVNRSRFRFSPGTPVNIRFYDVYYR